MESPVKKLDFGAADKENQPLNEALPNEVDSNHTPVVEETKKVEKEETAVVAAGLEPEECDEPLLQDNPQRFVLFPIKYHEVRDAY